MRNIGDEDLNSSNKSSIHITVDVEDISGSSSDLNFARALAPLLDFLREFDIKATFFVVGSIANMWKSPLIHLAHDNHEIGLHGHTHEYLAKLGPESFQAELRQGREILEDLLGQKIAGYRAPFFSLTNEAMWAPEILKNEGFSYSSSVLPCWNPQAGFPQAPKFPFLWPCGLVEFPVPTFGFGNLRAPLLGGAYLRLCPAPLFHLARFIGSRRAHEWTYVHPYDFDTESDFEIIRGTSYIFSKLIFARRNLMIDRVLRLSQSKSQTFQDLVDEPLFRDSLTTFNPS